MYVKIVFKKQHEERKKVTMRNKKLINIMSMHKYQNAK